MRTIIAGSRTITDREFVFNTLNESLWVITEVFSGCARGVDRIGEEWAELNNIPVKKFPANWEIHGRSAGPIRNREMADRADALIAFWDNKSRGTENMIAVANLKGLLVRVYSHD